MSDYSERARNQGEGREIAEFYLSMVGANGYNTSDQKGGTKLEQSRDGSSSGDRSSMSNLHMAVLYYDDGSAQPLLGRKSVRDFYMRALPQDEEYHWNCFHSQILGTEQKIQLR